MVGFSRALNSSYITMAMATTTSRIQGDQISIFFVHGEKLKSDNRTGFSDGANVASQLVHDVSELC